MAYRADRRAIAAAHAGRMHDAHFASELARQILHELLGTGHCARQRVAHAHSNRRRRPLAFLHDIEVRVESRDLINFGERHLHFERKRREMRR